MPPRLTRSASSVDGWRMTLTPSRNPCGALKATIAGETCLLRCSGAMYVVAHDVLIVADLHLEKGSSYAVRGQMLPPYDSAATLARLENEIAELNPALDDLLQEAARFSIVLLGAIQGSPDVQQSKPEKVTVRSGREPLLRHLEMPGRLVQVVRDAQSVGKLRHGADLKIGILPGIGARRHRPSDLQGGVAVLHHAMRVFVPQVVHSLEQRLEDGMIRIGLQGEGLQTLLRHPLANLARRRLDRGSFGTMPGHRFEGPPDGQIEVVQRRRLRLVDGVDGFRRRGEDCQASLAAAEKMAHDGAAFLRRKVSIEEPHNQGRRRMVVQALPPLPRYDGTTNFRTEAAAPPDLFRPAGLSQLA